MDKDWLENNLRNRFDGQEAPMDMEAEWAALQNRRQPKKSRRFLLWWFGGLGSFAILSMLLWTFNNNSDLYALQDNNVQYNEQKTTHSTASITPIEKPVTLPTKKIESTNATLLASTHQDDAPSEKEEINSVLEKISALNNEKIGTKNSKINDKNRDVENIKILNNTTSFPSIKEQIIQTKTKKSIESVGVTEQDDSLLLASQKLTKNLDLPILLEKRTVNYLENSTITNLIKYDFKMPTLKPWEELPKVDDLPQYNTNKYNKGLGVHIGYGWNNRTLEAENSSSQDIIQRRNDAELTLDVIDISLSYRQLLNQKIYVEGHLGVQQSMDRLDDYYANTEPMLIENQPIVIRNLPDGTTETEMGTIEATVFNSVQATFYQTYRQAYGNIWIGFYDQTEADWIVSIATGLDVAIWNSANGNTFQDAERMGEYTRLEDSSYKKSGVLSALMRLEGSRLINQTNELGLGIQGKINITDNYNSINIAERRQWITGNIFYRKWF